MINFNQNQNVVVADNTVAINGYVFGKVTDEQALQLESIIKAMVSGQSIPKVQVSQPQVVVAKKPTEYKDVTVDLKVVDKGKGIAYKKPFCNSPKKILSSKMFKAGFEPRKWDEKDGSGVITWVGTAKAVKEFMAQTNGKLTVTADEWSERSSKYAERG